MIISASRRTDIPSYYGQWFVNALQRGHIFVPNPYNKQRYYKVDLRPQAVDCIVFWTKNPLPFFPHHRHIESLGYASYFQFTITPYNRSVEAHLPDKLLLIQAFKELSKTLGPHRMVWRYDPIILNNTFTVEYHEKAFRSMAKMLQGFTQRCVMSFVDIYKNLMTRLGQQSIYTISCENMHILAASLAHIAHEHDFSLFTCAEEHDFSSYGIEKSSCIDKSIIENVLGKKTVLRRDKNQRPACACMESIEVGTYNCCANGCNYCYALQNITSNAQNMRQHNPNSPVLIGELPENALITQRENSSVIETQGSLL